MKKLILFALISALIFSCRSEDFVPETNPQFNFECLLSAEVEDISQLCDSTDYDTAFVCEKICYEETLYLDIKEKEWLPYFCLEIGQRIFFNDGEGNQTFFEITGKEYKLKTINYIASDTCMNGLQRAFFYNTEEVLVSFSSDLLRKDFNLTLSYLNSFYSLTGFERVPSVQISSRNRLVSLFPNVTDFYAQLKPDGTADDFVVSLDFLPELKVYEKSFSDVVTYNAFLGNDHTEIFYNQEFGIVSFIDQSGKQWVFNN